MTPTTIEPEKAAKLRHEIKHQIAPREDLVLSGRLKKLFSPDAHAGPNGEYLVTSLYFDTFADDALREKLSGLGKRVKFRLRYYGKNPKVLRLEKKEKIGSLCKKQTAALTLEQAQALLQSDLGFLLDAQEPLCAEFYSRLQGEGLRPKAVVRYRREAYVYPPGNVRITIDRDIRTGVGETGFFEERLPLPALQGLSVLEIKYDAFLPEIVKMAVQVPNRQAAACSKYALCRRFD